MVATTALMKLNISLKILQLVRLKLNVREIPCGRISFQYLVKLELIILLFAIALNLSV